VKYSLCCQGKSFGYDVSKTATKKAASNFQNSGLSVFDLTLQPNLNKKQKEDCNFL
jgi:hypothetical protein